MRSYQAAPEVDITSTNMFGTLTRMAIYQKKERKNNSDQTRDHISSLSYARLYHVAGNLWLFQSWLRFLIAKLGFIISHGLIKQVPVYYAVADSTPRIEIFNELILLPVDDGADDDGMVLQDDLT
ncbi:hypothetical protein D5086_031397 [Populus alba]|uniref:Uncharacterized protein n=1 Tax=Populus alba TaxID=43335 RepID=A0ACC4AIG8_POPAL